ncbi:HesA/MoeB/ThiF family protein [Priestia koreensis]|uniref:HesA/MoeB/ThiF family protein n=1 Tax=Priestia koreensis TaxID=284581 RepID=UPI001F55B87E|nr:ThiF family adenylyltransferase [Priestia koreensis]UNL87537.1 ThiF family adenylyltransferase [Priestia koreensis]
MDKQAKFKLKDTFFIAQNGDKVQFGDEPGYSFEVLDESGFFQDFIVLLDGTNTIQDIKSQLQPVYPEITEDYIEELILDLDRNFLITVHNSPKRIIEPKHISNLNFFENFSTLGNTNEDLLDNIRNLKLGIVGLGGLGSNILMQLAGLGVNNIYIIEPDNVEEKNLNRQFLYRISDIGKPKAIAAKENIYGLNPDIKISTKILEVASTQDLLTHLPNDIDLLICAADQPLLKIQLWCNQFCLINDIPLITGGLGCTQGHFLTVIPNQTPCLECFYHNLLKNDEVKKTLNQLMDYKNKNAALGNSINLIASSIISEIIKIFSLDLAPVSLGKRVFIDFINLTYNYENNWLKDESCNCNNKPSLPMKTVLEELEGDLLGI